MRSLVARPIHLPALASFCSVLPCALIHESPDSRAPAFIGQSVHSAVTIVSLLPVVLLSSVGRFERSAVPWPGSDSPSCSALEEAEPRVRLNQTWIGHPTQSRMDGCFQAVLGRCLPPEPLIGPQQGSRTQIGHLLLAAVPQMQMASNGLLLPAFHCTKDAPS